MGGFNVRESGLFESEIGVISSYVCSRCPTYTYIYIHVKIGEKQG